MLYLRLLARVLLYGFLAVTICNGCTTINIINRRLSQLMYVDSAFDKYAHTFNSEAKKRSANVGKLHNLTMIFGTTGTKDDPGTIGTCSVADGFPLIIIDRRFWAVADEYEREELIFHELGHCLLDRDHCEPKKSGKSLSIMEPDLLGSAYYKVNRENLVDELFNPAEGCGSLGENADGVNVHLH